MYRYLFSYMNNYKISIHIYLVIQLYLFYKIYSNTFYELCALFSLSLSLSPSFSPFVGIVTRVKLNRIVSLSLIGDLRRCRGRTLQVPPYDTREVKAAGSRGPHDGPWSRSQSVRSELGAGMSSTASSSASRHIEHPQKIKRALGITRFCAIRYVDTDKYLPLLFLPILRRMTEFHFHRANTKLLRSFEVHMLQHNLQHPF